MCRSFCTQMKKWQFAMHKMVAILIPELLKSRSGGLESGVSLGVDDTALFSRMSSQTKSERSHSTDYIAHSSAAFAMAALSSLEVMEEEENDELLGFGHGHKPRIPRVVEVPARHTAPGARDAMGSSGGGYPTMARTLDSHGVAPLHNYGGKIQSISSMSLSTTGSPPQPLHVFSRSGMTSVDRGSAFSPEQRDSITSNNRPSMSGSYSAPIPIPMNSGSSGTSPMYNPASGSMIVTSSMRKLSGSIPVPKDMRMGSYRSTPPYPTGDGHGSTSGGSNQRERREVAAQSHTSAPATGRHSHSHSETRERKSSDAMDSIFRDTGPLSPEDLLELERRDESDDEDSTSASEDEYVVLVVSIVC